MDDKQYDVADDVLKQFKLKQQQRNEAKAYFRRIIENPHRSIHDPPPFDPVVHRFNAMNAYKIDHFKPNPRNVFHLCTILLIPLVGVGMLYRHNRMKNDSMYREGKVAYKDRMYKLIM